MFNFGQTLLFMSLIFSTVFFYSCKYTVAYHCLLDGGTLSQQSKCDEYVCFGVKINGGMDGRF